MTVGQNIREARKSAGLTQAQLAERLNIPFQSVSQWERNIRTPKIETLKRIAGALGIVWIHLLSDVDMSDSMRHDVLDTMEQEDKENKNVYLSMITNLFDQLAPQDYEKVVCYMEKLLDNSMYADDRGGD